MPNEPQWVTAEQLVRLNAAIVTETGEPHFVRDVGLLESARAKPINHWRYGEGDVVVLAVTLLLGIGRNHPFGQGNKRTAFAAADAFLNLNGYELALPDDADVADLIVEAIIGKSDEARLIDLFEQHVQPI